MEINPGFRETKFTEEEWDKGYHAYRQAWSENARRGIVNKFPLHLDLELTIRCNLKCPFCIREYTEEKSGDMEKANIIKIFKEANGHIPSYKFNWRGEPLMAENLCWAIGKAKVYGAKETAINTNGTLLKGVLAEELLESGLDRLIVSIDSINPANYEAQRVGAKFNKTIKNLRDFIKMRDERGLKRPYIRVQKIDLPEVRHENQRFIDYFEQMGVDSVAINTYKEKNKGKVDWEPLQCAQLWQRLLIAYNGDIYPCCQGHNFKTLGNIESMTIEAAWNSQFLKNLRIMHSTNNQRKVPQCRECETTRPG